MLIPHRQPALDTGTTLFPMPARMLVVATTLLLVVACAGTDAGKMRGHYYRGHDVESFQPCGDSRSFRVVGDAGVLRDLRARADALRTPATPHPAIPARISGGFEGKATDGFAADHDGVLRIRTVEAIDAAAPADCPPTFETSADDAFFRITPVRPIPELLAEALAATPPQETGGFRATDLVEVTALEPGIRLDIRYAGPRNFLGTPVYGQARAFLQRPAAQALARVHRALAAQGYGLLVHDAYRPWHVTKVFWDATPPAHHDFVADPAKGSRHNRGSAVDATLFDLRTGDAVAMPSLYDEMSERSHPDYAGGDAAARARRDLLRRAMEAEGFSVYPVEWWHFDHRDWAMYRLQDVRFEDIPQM